jgi:head-tail adaptor
MTFKITPAGMRRRMITLVRRNDAQDAFGQATGYSAYATVSAYMEALTGRTVNQGGALGSQVSHRFNIRYRPDLEFLSKDRVLYNPAGLSIANGTSLAQSDLASLVAAGGRIFDVSAVENPEERNIEINLFCLEISEGEPAGV